MIEFYQNGIRTVMPQKGKNCCLYCQYCKQARDNSDIVFCQLREKNNKIDTRFPYDNTSCPLFKQK